jgi:hypothetical protein
MKPDQAFFVDCRGVASPEVVFYGHVGSTSLCFDIVDLVYYNDNLKALIFAKLKL